MGAVCRREDVLVGDEAAAAEGFVEPLLDERHLPRKLVGGGPLTSDDPKLGGFQLPADAVGHDGIARGHGVVDVGYPALALICRTRVY